MSELKTKPTAASPQRYVAALSDESRRRDCGTLLEMMAEIAGEPPRMWGESIVGFGSLDYRYASGHSGTWFRCGFSSRKNALTLYFMLDLDRQADALARLGKHKRGKSCLYVKTLADIDTSVLRDLIRESCDPSGGTCGGAH